MIDISIYYPVVKIVGELESDKVHIEFVLPKKPFLFWCDIRDNEVFLLPKGYGMVWYDLIRRRYLYAPMPFNILIGFGIWLWNWVRYGATYWMAKHKS